MYALALGRWLTEAIPAGFWSLGSILELSFISTTYNIPTIGDIQGPSFLSRYDRKTLRNITGLVTAKVLRLIFLPPPDLSSSKGPAAFWLASKEAKGEAVSIGIMVYSPLPTDLQSVEVGDMVSLSAKVSEFQSTFWPNDLHLTQLTIPKNITIITSNNSVVPIVLGRDRSPPTQDFSSKDIGKDGFLSVPGGRSYQEFVCDRLQPDKYGLDFWESLEGQVVTIPKPFSLGFSKGSDNRFWVRGNWRATGVNSRNGLTITFGT